MINLKEGLDLFNQRIKIICKLSTLLNQAKKRSELLVVYIWVDKISK